MDKVKKYAPTIGIAALVAAGVVYLANNNTKVSKVIGKNAG